MAKATKAKTKGPQLAFYQRLVLNRYLLKQFGHEDFKQLARGLKEPKLEAIDEEGATGFYRQLVLSLPDNASVTKDKLAEYDLNIVRHLQSINTKRDDAIRLKYFQYLSLLFVEYYLDQFFNDKNAFLEKLNEFVADFNCKNPSDAIDAYAEKDLNKLALWNATGSGKTFLMHINYHQYLHYAKSAGKIDDASMFILLTPKEDLSLQHAKELAESSISAKIFDKDASRTASSATTIQILENTKLGEKHGDLTVAVQSLGDSNIVFVDEGHRGSSGDKWYKNRSALCENGFSFEYSATFGQAVSTNALLQEYAKCIIFDYSYKYFYNDGFGKDYSILNLESDEDTAQRKLYLAASILSFYQQKIYFLEQKSDVTRFNLENPLFIFVGSSVNAVRTENKRQVSDVVDILLFIKEFVEQSDVYTECIQKLLNGNALLDKAGHDIFAGSFSYVYNKTTNASSIYQGICKTVFNCASKNALLHIEELGNGEIQVRLGENDPFGLIHVGDASKLRDLCDKSGFHTSKVAFKESLFHGLNMPDSTINILIGSKKFTEGWSSWRVSSMGLMNIGRSEGSEIIQLFGRGVRLKGFGMSLKRSNRVVEDVRNLNVPKKLQLLETLNIFGIRADYMDTFKKMLEDEGIPDKRTLIPIEMSVIRNKTYKKSNLLTLKLKNDLNYKKDAEKPFLEYRNGVSIELDCYAKVQFEKSISTVSSAITKGVHKLKDIHLALLDYDAIYFALQEHKRAKSRHNVHISMEKIREILAHNDWYTLYIPQDDLELKTFEDVRRIQSIVITLLKKYFDRLYAVDQNAWEKPRLVLKPFDDDDPNFLQDDMYSITVENPDTRSEMERFVEEIHEELGKAKGTIPEISRLHSSLRVLSYKNLLYSPFLYLDTKDKTITVAPVALNNSEFDFVTNLKEYVDANPQYFADKELYLIRNKSKKGIGFFENEGFYPDFIMWLVHNGKQYMTFIDPHGMRNTSFSSSKVQLCTSIKNIQNNLNDAIILNSFILSPTFHRDLVEQKTKEEWNDRHVLFMDEDEVNDGYIKDMFERIV